MHGRDVCVHMAHMPGQCALVQMPDGSTLLTSGVDATLRPHDIRDNSSSQSTTWWRADKPQEPSVPDLSASDVHEKPVTALAVTPNGNTLASASADGFVRIFSVQPPLSSSGTPIPNLQFLQACARFGAAVRAIDFSPSGAFLAAAGEEPGLVKVVMTAQPSSISVLRAPTTSPGNDAIFALKFDPKGDFVVTVGERGTAAVWDVDKCSLVATVDLNGRKASCLGWAPDGSALVFGTNKGAVVVSRMRWFLDCLLEDVTDGDDDDDIFASADGKNDVCAVAWSSNGRYVLTARKDCKVCLWDVNLKKILGTWRSKNVIQCLTWHAKTNAFVVIDTIGQWGIIPDVVPSHMPSPFSDSPLVKLPSIPDTENTKKAKKKDEAAETDDDADDGDNGSVVKRSKGAEKKRQKALDRKKAKEAKERKKKSGQQSDAELDGDEQPLEDRSTFNPDDVDADDEDDADRDGNDSDSYMSQDSETGSDEDVPGELAGLENGGVRLPEPRRRRKSRAKGSGGRALLDLPQAQTAFMPSATPLSEKSSKKVRILVWNLVGAILSFDEGTHDVVEVEFAEATRRSIGIKDHFGYTLGCLSDTGVLLGSNKTKEHGSVVSFRPFSSWAQNADWTQFMPNDEDISVIALGQRFAAVATLPNNIVRIFSLSGIQIAAYGVPGTVVSATSSGNMLALVYNELNSATLKVEILEVNSLGELENIRYDGALMLSAESQLEWIGFTTDSKEFCSYDSKGWLWMMTDTRNTKRWVPVVQNAAKRAECDWFWIAAVTSEQLLGVACLSNERHPAAKPRPGLRSIALTAPVIEQLTKNGKPTVAHRLARTRLKVLRALAAKTAAEEVLESDDEELAMAGEAVARFELEADKCTLSLMEDACRREQNMRALDLATRLNCKVSFKYAVELARHFKRAALATRVEQVATQKIAVIEDEERAREHRSRPIGTSPISLQNGEAHLPENTARLGGNLSTPPAQRRFPKMEFSEDEEHVTSKKVTEKTDKETDLKVTDVTDDEEDKDEKTSGKNLSSSEEDGKQEHSNTRSKEAVAKKSKTQLKSSDDGRGKKRRAGAHPQSNEKTTNLENDTQADISKKLKVQTGTTTVTKPTTVNPKFISFKNRFLKK